MPENIPKSRGVPEQYKLDRGDNPAWQGLFVGVVKNNVDPTRSGALEVFIEQMGGNDSTDPSTWRKVNYCSPFYGITNQASTSAGAGGQFNPQSYGMWFTPPDIGVKVICFFVGGDPSKGYYLGAVPEPGFNHMLPAIGASKNYATENSAQAAYYGKASRLPVTEINAGNESISNNPQFYNQPKPVHAVQAAILFQQGLINDPDRGTITSNAQRETPSRVFGISTPGRPVYAGGLTSEQIQQGLAENSITPEQSKIQGREGGHSIVLDDGDTLGSNNLVRIRSSKGHQVIMNDSAEFFYISHANGQTWIELGREGTVDVFSTNSINLRSQGDVNIHADRDIRMFAGGNFYVNAEKEVKISSTGISQITSEGRMTLATTSDLGLLASNSVSLKGKSGFFGVEKKLGLVGSKVLLNSGGVINVPPPVPIQKTKMDDAAFSSSSGWEIKRDALESIVTRAPTHEPYAYHGMGVGIQVALEPGKPSVPPGAKPMPPDWKITIS